MKRVILLFLVVFTCVIAFAQTNKAVDLSDDVYSILQYAELKGYIKPLPGNKPYSQNVVKNALNEILEYEDKLSDTEISLINEILDSYSINYDNKRNNLFHANIRNKDEDNIFLSFNYDSSLDTTVSGAIYSDKSKSQYSYEIFPELDFYGDISKFFTYRFDGLIDILCIPMVELGDYYCGSNWYDSEDIAYTQIRTVKIFENTSYLPYRYNKKWDGQIYYFSNLASDGLEGWPFVPSITLNITADLRASFFDDHLIVGFGRIYRDIASMDNSSSLVLNANARPFAALDVQANIFDFLKFSFVTGSLEYPNQDYLNKNWYINAQVIADDATYFQNNFTLNMLEIDYKFFHLDMGSTVVWPNRFQLGYLIPLINYVEYQNHVGDCDNLGMFGDIKLRKEGLGDIWLSVFLDEINLRNNPFTDTRDMFSYQLGLKYVVPKLSLATISFRYTKVEPFCYTHQSINYTPWFNHYISENYTTGGQSLGYYLEPNSDEFRLDFDYWYSDKLKFNTCYQMIRHGADYGTMQVQGGSLYSELNPWGRNDLHKYFLHDGAYKWSHILSFTANFNEKKTKLPFDLTLTTGVLYSYFTAIAEENYDFEGKCNNCNFETPYSIINTSEYPMVVGGIITIECKIKL